MTFDPNVPCDLHEMIGCAICKAKVQPPPEYRPPAARGGRFRNTSDLIAVEAQYEGRCSECDGPIEVGDLIVPDETREQFVGGGQATVHHGWKHRTCP